MKTLQVVRTRGELIMSALICLVVIGLIYEGFGALFAFSAI
jgi:hypothetical protein